MTQIDKTALDEAINRVIDYQKWRRGDEELQQPHPVELGADLDELIKAAQAYRDLPEKIESKRRSAVDYITTANGEYNKALDDILNILKTEEK